MSDGRALAVVRGFAAPAGVLILVLAIVAGTLVPGNRVVPAMAGLGAALLLAGVALDRARLIALLKGKRARAAGASAGYVVVVVAVLALANFLAGRHHLRHDLTENKAFSLSEQTIKVLKGLPREVSVTYFYREDPARQKLEDLLKEYSIHGARLATHGIDPDRSPGDVKRYDITEYGTIVVESGGRESRITSPDEESLTNAIIKATQDRERVVYFTTGHGERSLEPSDQYGLGLFKGELEKQHYVVKTAALNQEVPGDASLVVIAGPRKAFLESEAGVIGAYLEKGGHVLYLQDPDTDPGLSAVLQRYGLAVRHDVVIDKVSQLFGADARIPMVSPEGYDETHAVTRTFRYQTFYPLASSIEIATDLPEGVTATRLAETSAYSWGETSQEQFKSGRITLDEGQDVKGPVVIAAAATRKAAEQPAAGPAGAGAGSKPAAAETRLLVFGDSDFATNGYFNASGNGDLALSSVAWLAEQEDLVSIRPKTPLPRIVIMTPREMAVYFWTIVALAPVTICAIGVGVWVRRKKL